MTLLSGLILAFCVQDDAARVVKFPVGTKWIYTSQDTIQKREMTSETTVTESRADAAVIETRILDAGKEVGQRKVQTWTVKDGMLMLDVIPVYKTGTRRGDQWTYKFRNTEIAVVHDGIDELRLPAGLYRDAIHLRHKAPGGDLHQWIVPSVGVVKSIVPLGPGKGELVMELKEFVPVGGAAPAPAAAPRLIRAHKKSIDPWEGQKPDSWFRYKVAVGDKESFHDTGLKGRDDAGSTLLVQVFKEGLPEATTESVSKRVPMQVTGEETLRIQNQSFRCEVRSPIDEAGAVAADEREWAVKEGKHAGAVLKAESPRGTLLTTKAWEYTMKLKGREFDCLVLESESKAAGQTTSIKTWFCGALPRPFKIEDGETTVTLVDLGSGWSTRPPFPGAK